MAGGAIRAELSGDQVTEEAISTAVYHYSTDEGAMLAVTAGPLS
jgi:hypothetical protein